jgi:hypothetical protein
MNLQYTLDSLRLVLRTQSPRDVYGKYQVAAIMCIDSSNLHHYFLSKLKNYVQLNFTFCNDTFDREVRR